jgi:hypothetical protein
LLSVYRAHRNIHAGQELKWDIMSEVKDYLFARHIERIGIGDTGLEDQLLYLSKFELDTEEVFSAEYKNISLQEAQDALVKRFKSEKKGYYLFRAQEASWIPFFGDFRNTVLKSGKNLFLERRFISPEGIVVYLLYRVS